jgi:hypothetical protein
VSDSTDRADADPCPSDSLDPFEQQRQRQEDARYRRDAESRRANNLWEALELLKQSLVAMASACDPPGSKPTDVPQHAVSLAERYKGVVCADEEARAAYLASGRNWPLESVRELLQSSSQQVDTSASAEAYAEVMSPLATCEYWRAMFAEGWNLVEECLSPEGVAEATLERLLRTHRVDAPRLAYAILIALAFPTWWPHWLRQTRDGQEKTTVEDGPATPAPPVTTAAEPTPRSVAGNDLSPSRRKAYSQYVDAIRRNAALNDADDEEVYAWLKDNIEIGEALPSFATWRRYVTEVRKATGTNKHTSRKGRTAGMSIVRQDQI